MSLSVLKIQEIASRFGFDQMGVTKPAAMAQGEEAVRKWVEDGKHGSMKYLQEFDARRERFFRDFPDAKSVIVLGINYYTSGKKEGGPLAGHVARYAWGQDYHLVIRKRHEEFIAALKKETEKDFKAISCVDTQPLPERFAAQKAGLGFFGKHTGILSAEFGPWLFLSEIVTDLDLEESIPAQGDCGTCDHCQTVCPTGALDQDYKLDARLCIAYLTIEHKGIIPRELRPKIKNWIFGCDECLAICPFTSKSKEGRWPELGRESGKGEWLEIGALFKIQSNKEFEDYFAGTALLRSTRKQMMRNACIVLGNSKHPDALPYIKKALQDPSELVRAHAVWALQQFDSPEAKTLLEELRTRESNPQVLEEFTTTCL